MSVASETSRSLSLALLGLLVLSTVPGCGGEPAEPEAVNEVTHSVDTTSFNAHYARQWMANLGNSIKFDKISPPLAARTYAYGSIAMYEAVVHGMPGYQSLAGQLNGLTSLPTPDPGLEYDWPTVLAHTMDRLVRSPLPGNLYVFPNRIFYEFTTFPQAALWLLGPTQIGYRQAAGVPEAVIRNSMAFAHQLADALNAWMAADGYLDLRYKGFVPPLGPDKWVPTSFSDTDKVADPWSLTSGRFDRSY